MQTQHKFQIEDRDQQRLNNPGQAQAPYMVTKLPLLEDKAYMLTGKHSCEQILGISLDMLSFEFTSLATLQAPQPQVINAGNATQTYPPGGYQPQPGYPPNSMQANQQFVYPQQQPYPLPQQVCGE